MKMVGSPYAATKKQIAQALAEAVSKLGYGEISAEDALASIDLSRNFGDIASSAPLKIAKARSLPAQDVAEAIARRLMQALQSMCDRRDLNPGLCLGKATSYQARLRSQ